MCKELKDMDMKSHSAGCHFPRMYVIEMSRYHKHGEEKEEGLC